MDDIRRLESGYWVIADNRMVRCYHNLEEAQAHIDYQQKQIGSRANWQICKIKVTVDLV